MTDWYYARGGQQFGPFPLPTIKELARAGELDPNNDLLWNAALPEWTPAGKVAGIFNPSPSGEPATSDPMATPPASVPDPAPFHNPASPAARDPFLNPYAAPGSALAPQPQAPLTAADGTIPEIEPGSHPFDIMQVVGRGFQLTIRHFGFIFLLGVVYFATFLAFYAGLTGLDILTGWEMNQGGEYVGLSPWSNILSNLASVFLSLGITRIGLNLISGKPVEIGQLFGEGRKFLRAIGASIIYFLGVAVGILLLIVPGIYLGLRYGQYFAAIVDRDLGVMESLNYSASITRNNKVNLVLLWLLSIAIMIGGILALCVGLLVAAPAISIMYLLAYRWMQYGPAAVEDQPGTRTPLLANTP